MRKLRATGLQRQAVEDNHRLILVINGLPSMPARADEPATLMEWGWHEFRLLTLFKQGQVLDQVPVWLGTAPGVAVVAADADVKLTLSNEERRGLKAVLVYDQPVPAPIKAGQKIGVLKITLPNQDTIEVPLVATADVPRLGATAQIFAAPADNFLALPFITFEGGEGAGKSTQITALRDLLTAKNIPVTATHEPGGTEGALAIRQLLVVGERERWFPPRKFFSFMPRASILSNG